MSRLVVLALLALCVALVSCSGLRPAPVPMGVGAAVTESLPVALPVAAAPARERLVGLVCPRGAAGRPALAALALRLPRAWSGDPVELRRALGSGRTAELAVLSFAGGRAGWFSPAGLAESELASAVAIGAYAGALPCAVEATATECQAVTGGCGLAVGSPAGDDPTPRVGGACALGSELYVDVDGDGRLEAFSLGALAALGEEVTGGPAQTGDACVPRFALATGNDLDVVAVADLDGDGRVELVLSRRGSAGRRLALYTAETPFRLARVAVADVR